MHEKRFKIYFFANFRKLQKKLLICKKRYAEILNVARAVVTSVEKKSNRHTESCLISTPPPLVGAKTLEIARKASFCRKNNRKPALEPPKCVFSSCKQYNDVRTSGTWSAHTRHTPKTKIFGFGEILLQNSFWSTCAYNVPGGCRYFYFITVLKYELKAFQRRVAS